MFYEDKTQPDSLATLMACVAAWISATLLVAGPITGSLTFLQLASKIRMISSHILKHNIVPYVHRVQRAEPDSDTGPGAFTAVRLARSVRIAVNIFLVVSIELIFTM